MKKALLLYYLFFGCILSGILLGLFVNSHLLLLIPLGFIGCLITSFIGSFLVAIKVISTVEKIK